MNSTCHVLPSEDLALLWAYMLSPASIAQCTCSDVHKLRFTAVSSSENVFYLNKFPCRRALIVGTVVGVTLGEGRVVYLVDDGTEVLECICWSKAVPQEVDKQKGWTEGSVFRVGHVVQVMGKVESYRDDRQLNVESLALQTDLNAESSHLLQCAQLARTKYSKVFSISSSMQAARPPSSQSNPTSEFSFISSPPRSQSSFNSYSSNTTISEMSYFTQSTSSGQPKLIAPSKIPDSALTNALFTLYLSAYFHRHSTECCTATTILSNSALKLLSRRIIRHANPKTVLTSHFNSRKVPLNIGKQPGKSPKREEEEKSVRLVKSALRELMKNGVIVPLHQGYVLFTPQGMEEALRDTLDYLGGESSLHGIVNHVQELDEGRWRFLPPKKVREVLDELGCDGSSSIMPCERGWMLIR